MAQALFGTDGIRGKAGAFPLDVATIRRVGAALVKALPESGARLLIGRDTRESGEWIERELAYGAIAAGATVESIGVAPTPAVAYLTGSMQFAAGVVISASHNPFEDNGIKVFSGSGQKHGEHFEEHVEQIVADASWALPDAVAQAVPTADLLGSYVDHASTVLPEIHSLAGMRIAVDCANGAMTSVAPALLRRLGFDLTVLADRPDGRNINRDVGSTHPQTLADTVRSGGHRLGVAFDGDGDRAIFVDGSGRVLDGDHIMFLCARQMQAEGRLRGNAIVSTVMSNIGLEIALRRHGIGMVRTAVGDKYVMEEMQRQNLSIGGEQSGHLIFSDYLSTGDGLITALNVLRTVAVSGRELADLAGELETYPQVLINVRVHEKVDLRTVPEIAAVMEDVEGRLGTDGRLLVRYSGTEPLVRVMLEGRDKEEIARWGQEIVDVVRDRLSGS